MAYISLYRKYRPHKFNDVVGQEIVLKILKNSIINDKINHAYIFSGPRGTGKTSIAKIFAKAVNCLKKSGDVCDDCDVCNLNTDDMIDIVEIDAASNNGIEEIREIRNTIKLLPTILKYKVYIIDEVHMLSTSAFNALLKTLEEPPSHAIFILATTEINKIPSTVLSRCQKFDFKKIDTNLIVDRLKYICDNEKIKIDNDILEFIAELSDGGLRDAINLLDQINSLDKKGITRTDVLKLIGNIDINEIFELFDNISSGNVENVVKNINKFSESNRNFIDIVSNMESIIKDILIFNNTSNYFDKEYEEKLYKYSKLDINTLIKISEELFNLYVNLKKSNNHLVIAEVIFIKITLLFNKQSTNNITENNVEKVDNNIVDKEKTNINSNENNNINSNEITENEKEIIINNSFVGANKTLKNEFLSKYGNINDYLTNKDYNSIANLLTKSSPEVVSEDYIIFTFKNNFEVLLFDKNIELIVIFLNLIYNKKYNIVAITEEKWKEEKEKYIKNIKNGKKYEYINIDKKEKKSRKKSTELEKSIENIFGEEYIVEN